MSASSPTMNANNVNNTQFGPFPETVRTQANTFVAKADSMAQEIIAKTESLPCEGPVIIRHYHYYNSPWYDTHYYSPFYSPYHSYGPSIIVLPSGRYDRDYRNNNNDNANAVLIGILAAVVGTIALIAIGSSVSRIQDANNELTDTNNLKNNLAMHQFEGTHQDQTKNDKISKIADLKERVCKRIKNSAVWDLALRIGLFVACGVALTGAIMHIPVFMTAGLVAGLAISCGMLMKGIADNSEVYNYRDARKIRAQVQNLG